MGLTPPKLPPPPNANKPKLSCASDAIDSPIDTSFEGDVFRGIVLPVCAEELEVKRHGCVRQADFRGFTIERLDNDLRNARRLGWNAEFNGRSADGRQNGVYNIFYDLIVGHEDSSPGGTVCDRILHEIY